MNKLFTKIAALALGAAMVVGVGVSIGSKSIGKAEAAPGDVISTTQWFGGNKSHSNAISQASLTKGGSKSFTDDNGLTWTLANDVPSSGTFSDTGGANANIQMGKASYGATYVTITHTTTKAYTLTSFSAGLSGSAAASSFTVDLLVGSVSLLNNPQSYSGSGTTPTYTTFTGSRTIPSGSVLKIDVSVKTNNGLKLYNFGYSLTEAASVTTLDAITAIGGSVKGTITNAGTTDWDYSGVTVTGTLSGATGQNVKEYVDLSSTTQIPSTLGNCIVSVTATKKSGVQGSATTLTNNNVSGVVEVSKLTYTVIFDYTSMLTTNVSYANENSNPKSSDAECSGHDDITIEWASYQVQRPNGTALWMQFQGSNKGHIYNTTEFPGTITGVTLTTANGSTAPFNTYYGNTEKPLDSQTVGGKFFTVQVQSGTGYLEKVTVTFEVSDKPKVQLSAQDVSLDITDGAVPPTVTDGTSAVTGYDLSSADAYVASITSDKRVKPESYGKVIVTVSKTEDDSHIYLATTFVVTVTDRSKLVSTMAFTEKAGSSAEADDGIVWSITANQSENDFSEVYGINYGSTGNKVSSLVLTTPADEQRIIKNVVIETMSATAGSTVAVSVGGTSFACNRSNEISANVVTYNFSGNISGAITITISGDPSTKYGVKSISILYVGDEATDFASTFLGAFTCNNSGTSKPSFNIKEGETYWTWSMLATQFNALSDKSAFAANIPGDEDGTTIERCLARYDYVVGKYFKTGVDTSFTDFMQRNPAPIGSGKIMLNPIGLSESNATTIIIIISVIGVSALGGFFFLRKRKEI